MEFIHQLAQQCAHQPLCNKQCRFCHNKYCSDCVSVEIQQWQQEIVSRKLFPLQFFETIVEIGAIQRCLACYVLDMYRNAVLQQQCRHCDNGKYLVVLNKTEYLKVHSVDCREKNLECIQYDVLPDCVRCKIGKGHDKCASFISFKNQKSICVSTRHQSETEIWLKIAGTFSKYSVLCEGCLDQVVHTDTSHWCYNSRARFWHGHYLCPEDCLCENAAHRCSLCCKYVCQQEWVMEYNCCKSCSFWCSWCNKDLPQNTHKSRFCYQCEIHICNQCILEKSNRSLGRTCQNITCMLNNCCDACTIKNRMSRSWRTALYCSNCMAFSMQQERLLDWSLQMYLGQTYQILLNSLHTLPYELLHLICDYSKLDGAVDVDLLCNLLSTYKQASASLM